MVLVDLVAQLVLKFELECLLLELLGLFHIVHVVLNKGGILLEFFMMRIAVLGVAVLGVAVLLAVLLTVLLAVLHPVSYNMHEI